MDVVAVEQAAAAAVAAVRAGEGPRFLECRTYRFRAHSMFDAELYRDKAEVARWKAHGPIVTFMAGLKADELANDEDLARLETEVDAEIAAAVEFAEAGEWEGVDDLARDVYTPEPGS